MLPRKLHLDEVNRFHDEWTKLTDSIENETDKDKKYVLLKKYLEITKLWIELDDFIEYQLKFKLDELK